MELKFRAWDRKSKKMFPVHKIEYSKIDNTIQWVEGVDIKDKESNHDGNVWYGGSYTKLTGTPPVKRFELMQFIGFKEKSPDGTEGKEVYVGDVVRCYGGEYCQGYWEHDITLTVDSLIYDGYTIGHFEYLEIWGNVHEHPDLIKKAN